MTFGEWLPLVAFLVLFAAFGAVVWWELRQVPRRARINAGGAVPGSDERNVIESSQPPNQGIRRLFLTEAIGLGIALGLLALAAFAGWLGSSSRLFGIAPLVTIVVVEVLFWRLLRNSTRAEAHGGQTQATVR